MKIAGIAKAVNLPLVSHLVPEVQVHLGAVVLTALPRSTRRGRRRAASPARLGVDIIRFPFIRRSWSFTPTLHVETSARSLDAREEPRVV